MAASLCKVQLNVDELETAASRRSLRAMEDMLKQIV